MAPGGKGCCSGSCFGSCRCVAILQPERRTTRNVRCPTRAHAVLRSEVLAIGTAVTYPLWGGGFIADALILHWWHVNGRHLCCCRSARSESVQAEGRGGECTEQAGKDCKEDQGERSSAQFSPWLKAPTALLHSRGAAHAA